MRDVKAARHGTALLLGVALAGVLFLHGCGRETREAEAGMTALLAARSSGPAVARERDDDSSGANGETKTVAEWLAIIQEEAEITATEKTPLDRIRLGAAIATDPYLLSPWKKLTEHQERCHEEYKQFMVARGEYLLDRWRRGESLEPGEQDYVWALKASHIHRGAKARRKKDITGAERDALQYHDQVERQGHLALRKGYLGEKLGADDIEALRDFRIWVHVHGGGVYNAILPYGIGLSRSAEDMFAIGAPAPDFGLLKMETVLGRDSYSDERPIDVAAPLKFAGLLQFFVMFPGYEREAKTGGRQTVRARPAEQEDDYVRLSSFRGRKPVVFVLADANDWFGDRTFSALEPIYRAYRDSAAIFRVNVTLSDQYMGVDQYCGPNPGKKRSVYPTRIEHRARTAKFLYMTYPNVSYPYLLDDISSTTRNTWRAQGDSQIVVVDADGKVAFEGAKGMGPWRGRDFPDYIMWANEIESVLVAVLNNGGRYVRTIKSHVGYARGQHYPNLARANRRPVLLGTVYGATAADQRHETAVLTSVDLENSVMTVVGDPGSAKEASYRIQLVPGTRITLNGLVVKPADLKAKDVVAVRYWVERGPDGGGALKAMRVRASRKGAPSMPPGVLIWLCGRIESVDADARRLVVELSRSRPPDWTGYHLWKREGSNATPAGAAEMRLAVMEKWVEPGDEPVRYTFAMDEAVGVFLNGMEVAPADLQPGDTIGVQYQTAQDGQDVVYPEFVRASRVGGENGPTGETE